MADQSGDVRNGFPLLYSFKKLPKLRQSHASGIPPKTEEHTSAAIPGSGGAGAGCQTAVANHFSGDALHDLSLLAGFGEQQRVRMGMNVDKSWRNDIPFGVYPLAACASFSPLSLRSCRLSPPHPL